MRLRLDKPDPAGPNLKTGAGAMYDIDFVVSGLAVKHGLDLRGNMRQRLRSLQQAGPLSDAEWQLLDEAAEYYRVLEHAIRLVTGRACKTLPVGEHARGATEELATRMLGREFAGGLDEELNRRLQATRRLYEHLMV